MTLKYLNFNAKLLKVYEQFCAPLCKKYAINQTGYDILLFLGMHPDHNTARDIRETCIIKSSILSITIEKLIQAGYLLRRSDQKDRRVQRLIPTKSAKQIIEEGIIVQERFEAAILQDMTENDLQTFAILLNKILNTTNKMEHKGGQCNGCV